MPESRTRQERGDAVRLERLRRRLNQDQIGAICGLNQATISKAEQGRGSDEVYDAIEQALDALAEAEHAS